MASDSIESLIQETSQFGIDRGQQMEPTQIQDGPRPGTRQGHNGVVDITEEFSRACAVLRTGQLVKDENYTLFESVAALEIMDPKMDSGFLRDCETLDDEYDVAQDLLPEQVLGIMDQMLCYEVAWHEGYPLSQTLFTSIYIDKMLWPEPRYFYEAHFLRGTARSGTSPLLDLVLRAYCLALVKCCDYTIKKLATHDYYEEEDFVTHTYNRDLLTKFANSDVISLIDQALMWIQQESGHLGLASDPNTIVFALKKRLEFRKSFLQAMLIPLASEIPLSSLPDLWDAVPDALPTIYQTHTLAQPVEEAFSAKVQRRLASTIPPKPIVKLSFEEAFVKLNALCRDCGAAVNILKLPTLESPATIMNYLMAFSSKKPKPLPYARACIGSILLSEFTEQPFPISQYVFADLAELVLPEDKLLDPANEMVEVPTDPRNIIHGTMNMFADTVMRGYVDFWSSLCQNRCRMRRTLCHVMVTFDQFHPEVEDRDFEIRSITEERPVLDQRLGQDPTYSSPLSSWVVYNKLRQVEWVIQLGFELEVYLPDELGGMYWILQQRVNERLAVLQHILFFINHKHSRLLKVKNPVTVEAITVHNTRAYVEALIREATGLHELALSLSKLYILLHYLSAIKEPPRPYGSSTLRYELRMKPFNRIVAQPEPIPFEEFNLATHPFGACDLPTVDRKTIVSTLTREGETAIQNARREFSELRKLSPEVVKCVGVEEAWGKNVSSTLLACIATGVAFATIRAAYDKDPENAKLKVEIPPAGKGYHDWWTVPKIETA